MTVKDDLRQINENIKEIYLILVELDQLETGENADYSDVVTEISWNKLILRNRLISLKNKAAINGGK